MPDKYARLFSYLAVGVSLLWATEGMAFHSDEKFAAERALDRNPASAYAAPYLLNPSNGSPAWYYSANVLSPTSKSAVERRLPAENPGPALKYNKALLHDWNP